MAYYRKRRAKFRTEAVHFVDSAQVNSMELPAPGPWDSTGDLGEGNSPSPLP
jgi:hypothetical protein